MDSRPTLSQSSYGEERSRANYVIPDTTNQGNSISFVTKLTQPPFWNFKGHLLSVFRQARKMLVQHLSLDADRGRLPYFVYSLI